MWGFLSVSPSSTVGPRTPSPRTAITNTNTTTTTVNDDDGSTAQDISQRMQQMIDLQYEYMTTAAETTISQTTKVATAAATDYDPPITDSPVLKLLPKTNYPTRNILPGIRNYQSIPSDPEMGRGQLFFPSDYPRPPLQNEFNQQRQQQTYPSDGHYTNYQHEQEQLQLQDDARHYDGGFEHIPQSTTTQSSPMKKILRFIYEADNLHRCCCFSAIDGVLTGAGIIATFCGMRLLEPQSSIAIKLIATAVAFCASTADALCMSVSHVWNTHIMATQSASERRAERMAFDDDRAYAKGKLVDLLLTRGMLKIDAMSIADTLEGYPDMFVSALVGDGYTALLGDESGSLTRSSSSIKNGLQGEYPQQTLGQCRSYGQFNEWEHDPVAAAVAASTQESQREGAVMFVAFSIFAIIPGSVYLAVGLMIGDSDKAVSVTSLSVFLTAVIMLVLGIWKRYDMMVSIIHGR